LERSIVQHAWHRGWHDLVSGAFAAGPAHHLPHWFQQQFDLMLYPSWLSVFGPAADRLWDNRTKQGLWDFGAQAKRKYVGGYLSESWKRGIDRVIDHSTDVLVLLSRFHRQ